MSDLTCINSSKHRNCQKSSHSRDILNNDNESIDFEDYSKIIELSSSMNFEENQSKSHITDERHSRYVKPTPFQSNFKAKHQIPVSELPEKYRSIFPFTQFNNMQSESFDAIYNTNNNCVISSPTGSGKTVLFEMAIIKLLQSNLDTSNTSDDFKILYMAPTKALCKEKYDDWCTKFQPLNCSVGLLTGDSNLTELDSIRKSTLIICTPERWDVLTRKWSDYSKLLDLVKLVLVDEIHFLRENRGTCLEVVITRMMTISLNLRIIALSATVPNINDVSNWIGKLIDNRMTINVQTLVYDDSYRSVAIKKTVYGYKLAGTTNPFKFEGYLNGKLPEVINQHSKNKPVMIFCPTRASTVTTAKYLLQKFNASFKPLSNNFNSINKDLVELVNHGIAYHHAGLNLLERKFIEDSFKKGSIQILVSTSTLAVGVNLPAYLVIIKGTKHWTNNGLEEYNDLDIMQMLGRAGRPQFEKEGACVIMTDATKKEKYLKLVKGTEKLESSLHLNIYENITAEITLKVITSLETAFSWLQSTFFYQRYITNPTAYSLVFSKLNQSHPLDVQLRIFLKNVLDELIQEQIIEIVDREYVSTSYGIAMSKGYVLFPTIKNLVKSDKHLSLKSCLSLISASEEFIALRIKLGDKRLLKDINASPLMYAPIPNNKINSFSDKVSIYIQFELGGIEFPMYQGSMKSHHEFIAEKMMIFKNLPRIIKAAIEIFSFKKDAISLNSMLKLHRCICAKGWENRFIILKQIEGIGLAYAKKLSNKGINSIDDIKNLSRDKIEYYIGLKPGSGQKIFKSVNNIPNLDLKINVIHTGNNGNIKFVVNVNVKNNKDNIKYLWNGTFAHIHVLTDVSGQVIDFRRMPLRKLQAGKQFTLQTTLKNKNDYIKVYFNCDEIAGIGKVETVDVSNSVKCLKENNEISNFFNKSIEINKEVIRDDKSSDVFSDDDNLIIAALDAMPNKNNKAQIETPQIQKGSDSSFEKNAFNGGEQYFQGLDTSHVGESSLIECNHKCNNKMECRHFCCKEGIPVLKAKACKHICKDKNKCRHTCCRYEYKKNHSENNIYKPLKQTFLKLDEMIKPSQNLNSIDIEFSDDDFETESGEDIADSKLASSNQKNKPKENKSSSSVPLFLRRIDKPKNLETKNSKIKTSKSKLGFKKRSKERKQCILELSFSNDSDDDSDSFNSAIEKTLNLKRMASKKEVFQNSKKQKLGEYSTNKIKFAKLTEELYKTKNIKSFNSKLNINLETSSDESDDIIILKPNESINYRCIANKTIANVGLKFDQLVEFETKNKMDEVSHNGDSTVSTSLIEEDLVDRNKEVLAFLDSDIEFE